MINLFSTSTNDQSIYFLGRIFGNVGDVLSGTGPALLGQLFNAFNTAALAIAVVIITYTTIMSILLTAHEGEFLGKKFHGLWVPLRSVMGIATLLPMKSGYCVIQVIMMWIIVQGVGAADTMWGVVIDYFEKGGAISTPAPSSYLTGGQYAKFATLFQDLTCQAAIKKFYCPTSKDPWCTASTDFTSATTYSGSIGSYPMGPGGACGILTWDLSNPQDQAKYAAYQEVMPTFIQISNAYVDAYYAYVNNTPDWQRYAASFPPISSSPQASQIGPLFWQYVVYPYAGSNFVRDAVNKYMGEILNYSTRSSGTSAAAGKYISGTVVGVASAGVGIAGMLMSNLTINVQSTLENARANGWIYAGGYYYFISSLTNKAVQSDIKGMLPELKDMIPGGTPTPVEAATKQYGPRIMEVYSVAGQIASTAKAQQDQGGGEGTFGAAANATSGNVVMDALAGAASLDLSSALVGGFMAMLGNASAGTAHNLAETTPSNPIVSLQAFGETIILVAQIILVVLAITIFSTSLATSFMASVQPLPYAVANISNFLIPIIMFLLLALFTFGATLAIYTPLIPYIIYTMAVIGWFIATIETMVAAPLVAIGIMSPSGEHEILGSAKPAMMLILNIFFRPSLMVLGLIAGMLLSYVVVTLVNAAYLGVMRQIYSGPGLVETCLFIASYCGIIITGLNKCFQLITLVPDRVMRWLSGGLQEAFGSEMRGAEGEVRGQFGGAAKSADTGAGNVGGAGQKVAEGKAKAMLPGASVGLGGGGGNPPPPPGP